MKKALLIHAIVVIAIIVLALSPLLATMVAGSIANANGCDLDEGSIHPCVVNGRDIGRDLYTWAMLGWLGIATVPLGLAVLGIYLAVVIVVSLIRWARRRKAQPEGVLPG